MQSIAWLGISPNELDDRVAGRVWRRWGELEPDLLAFAGLGELHELSGRDNDRPLGALARLAAADGHDDELAAIALAHQLERGARCLMHSLGDLSDDIEQVVMGALWGRIRCFPWRRRARAIAANILRDTRAEVLGQLPLRRAGGRRVCLPVDPSSSFWDRASPFGAPEGLSPGSAADQVTHQLIDVLEWAVANGTIRQDDRALLLDLLAASDEVSEQETPWMRRGGCSQIAVGRVAQQRGVCGKTIRRQRDRIVAALRAASGQYLADVA